MQYRGRHLMLILAVVSLGLNLRPALATVGPLLDTIEAATGLNHTQASLLTSLPVFVMGLCALAGGAIAARVGARMGIGAGAGLVALACLSRIGLTDRAGLLLTAAVAGLGIALVQTLLPAFIKKHFAGTSGTVFGLYTSGIMGGAAIAAACAAPFAEWWRWTTALAFWALPAFMAVWLWYRATASMAMSGAWGAAEQPRREAFWRNQRAWTLMLFFGIGTGAYTLVLAWLPPFYTSLGWAPSASGLLLGGLTVTEVLAGLIVAGVIDRFPDRRRPLLVALALLAAGLVCLMVSPRSLALPACLLLGLGIGALFPLSLIVTLDHVDDPARAGRLAAFVQGGGYIIASAMPLAAGMLRDRFADLTGAWGVMLLGTILLLGLCTRFSPASYRRMDWPRQQDRVARHDGCPGPGVP